MYVPDYVCVSAAVCAGGGGGGGGYVRAHT